MIGRTTILTAIFIVVVAFMFYQPSEEVGEIIQQKITLQISEEISLYGDFYPEKSNKGIILIHMYGEDRTSWDFLIHELREKEYNVLTLDLRGHGESKPNRELTQDDFDSMSSDLTSATDYLIEKKINEISIMGASLGANVGLNFILNEPKAHRLVLLSPGIEYRGINVLESAKYYDRPLLILSSIGDEYSWDSSNQIFNLSPSRVRLEPYEGNIHGINILKQIPKSKELLFKWLEEN